MILTSLSRQSARILIFMPLLFGCERDPTVTSWKLEFDNGWRARGIYRSDQSGVSYTEFHWSLGLSPVEQDVSRNFWIMVDGTEFAVWKYDPERLQAYGFKRIPSSEVRDGHEGWNARFSNALSVLEYKKDVGTLSRLIASFYLQSLENDEEQFRFDPGQGRFIGGPISEQDAAELIGGPYKRMAERYAEW